MPATPTYLHNSALFIILHPISPDLCSFPVAQIPISMRIYILYRALFIILLFPASLFAQWNKISAYPAAPSDSLKGIHMITEHEGFLAFRNFAGYTTDGGLSYSKREVQVTELTGGSFHFNGILALDKQIAFLYGRYAGRTVILKTADGGLSWKTVLNFLPSNDLTEEKGITHMRMVGNKLIAMHTTAMEISTDNGESWQWRYNSSGFDLTGFDIVNDKLAIGAAGNSPILYYLESNFAVELRGISGVELVAAPSAGMFYAFVNINSQTFYVYASVDNGKNWNIKTKYQDFPLSSAITSWHFINDSTGFAVMDGKIYKTDNYAVTWQLMQGDFSANRVEKLFMHGASVSFASGAGPALYTSNNQGGTPYPKAYFTADTVGVGQDSMVELSNFSSVNQRFEWWVNSMKIGTAFNARYKTNRLRRDTVLLIAINAVGRDTSKQLVETRYSDGNCNPSFSVKIDTSTVTLLAYDTPDYRLHVWNMGDGKEYRAQPHSIKHKYNKRGDYLIRHTIYDLIRYCSKTEEKWIKITDLTNCDFNPTLRHTADLQQTNQISFFQVELYENYPRAPVNFLWHFGDGDTSSNNIHTYKKSGTYYVKMEVRYKSCYREAFDTVVINSPDCSAKFFSINPGTPGYQHIPGPVNDPDIKEHTWIFNGKDTLRTKGHQFVDFNIYNHLSTDRSIIPCNNYPYAWHIVYNLDSAVRVVKHIISDNNGCYAEDSLKYPLFTDIGPMRIYQQEGMPYTFAFIPYEYSSTTKFFTIEGVECIPTQRAMFYTFRKPGTYTINLSGNSGHVFVYRQTFVVDGEMRYTFSGKYNEVTGLLFIDQNRNGIRDNNEPLYEGEAMIKGTSAWDTLAVSSANGRYRYLISGGNAKTTVTLPKPWYTVQASGSVSDFGDGTNLTDTIHFALQPLPGTADASVTMISDYPAAPGADARYRVQVKNKGLETLRNMQLVLVRDGKVQVDKMLPAPAITTKDSLTWTISELTAGNSMDIIIEGKILAVPDIKQTDTIQWSLKLKGIGNDADVSDNAHTYRQLLQSTAASVRMRDNQGGYWRVSQADSLPWITYEIHFQNTGQDTIFNMDIHDTLRTNLNWSSFEMLQASHPYKLNISKGNRLSWNFSQVLLPGSAVNDAASRGYLQFRIKPKPGLKTGDTVTNQATVYFDNIRPAINNRLRTNLQMIHIGDMEPPEPFHSTLIKEYCLSDDKLILKLHNLPVSPVKAEVTVDGWPWEIAADSTATIYFSYHGAGEHVLNVRYSFRDKHRDATHQFKILTKEAPSLKLDASVRVITDISVPLLITATPANGGEQPLFSYSQFNNFQTSWKYQSTENWISINPSVLPLGKCPIYVRMTSNRNCLQYNQVTDSIHITRAMITGIVDPSFPGSDIMVYPNPSTGPVTIGGLQASGKYELEIRDAHGRKVFNRSLAGRTSYNFELPGVNGLYFLTITDSRKKRLLGTVKLLKKQ